MGILFAQHQDLLDSDYWMAGFVEPFMYSLLSLYCGHQSSNMLSQEMHQKLYSLFMSVYVHVYELWSFENNTILTLHASMLVTL